VNEQVVHSVAQIESHLKNAKQMRLEVSRKGKTLSLALDVPS
jgi:hypothetical protein